MTENKLKLCPFCGGEAKLVETTECWWHGEFVKEYYVKCTKCMAHGESAYERAMSREDCIKRAESAWNRRTSDADAGYRKQSEGEWEVFGLANPKCSLCHSYNIEKTRFCPNCGAKMKGE